MEAPTSTTTATAPMQLPSPSRPRCLQQPWGQTDATGGARAHKRPRPGLAAPRRWAQLQCRLQTAFLRGVRSTIATRGGGGGGRGWRRENFSE